MSHVREIYLLMVSDLRDLEEEWSVEGAFALEEDAKEQAKRYRRAREGRRRHRIFETRIHIVKFHDHEEPKS